MISIQEQIACVQREIGIREVVYATFIGQRKMEPAKAASELAVMKAVLLTLRELADDGDDVGSSAVVA